MKLVTPGAVCPMVVPCGGMEPIGKSTLDDPLIHASSQVRGTYERYESTASIWSRQRMARLG